MAGANNGSATSIEAVVWKQKRATAMFPGYKKVYAKLDLETLELALMKKKDAPPKKYSLFTVVHSDTQPEETRKKKLYCALLPPMMIGMRIGLGIGGKQTYGMKLGTYHRPVQLFFESEAERERWSKAIMDSQKGYSTETMSPRKSTMKSLLGDLYNAPGKADEGILEKSAKSTEPARKSVALEASGLGLGVQSEKAEAPQGKQKDAQGDADKPKDVKEAGMPMLTTVDLPDKSDDKEADKQPDTAMKAQDLLVQQMAEVPPDPRIAEAIYAPEPEEHGCGCF